MAKFHSFFRFVSTTKLRIVDRRQQQKRPKKKKKTTAPKYCLAHHHNRPGIQGDQSWMNEFTEISSSCWLARKVNNHHGSLIVSWRRWQWCCLLKQIFRLMIQQTKKFTQNEWHPRVSAYLTESKGKRFRCQTKNLHLPSACDIYSSRHPGKDNVNFN